MYPGGRSGSAGSVGAAGPGMDQGTHPGCHEKREKGCFPGQTEKTCFGADPLCQSHGQGKWRGGFLRRRLQAGFQSPTSPGSRTSVSRLLRPCTQEEETATGTLSSSCPATSAGRSNASSASANAASTAVISS